MFTYAISPDTDNKIFLESCVKIEANIKTSTKEDILIDVDGSLIQIYVVEGKKIKLHNDFLVGAVYIKSEIDLSNIFE